MNVKQAANVLDLMEFFAAHKQPATLADPRRNAAGRRRPWAYAPRRRLP